MRMLFFFITLLLLPLTAFGQTVFFGADAESGTVKPPWGGISTYSSGDYVDSSTGQAHAGSRSYKFYVNSPANFANDAKVWTFPRKTVAYYSSWYYIAQGYDDTQWRNNFQFKTDNGGATVKGGPKIIIGFELHNGIRQLNVNIRGCRSVNASQKPSFGGAYVDYDTTDGCKLLRVSPVSIPKGAWFHLEMYLKTTTTNGNMIIWQDGQEVFNLSHSNFDTLTTWGVDEPTKRSDNAYLYWTIGNYVSIKAVGTQVLYADDAFVTDYQISATTNNPPPATLAAPSNPRITLP